MGGGGGVKKNRRVTDQIPSDRAREEDRCREGKTKEGGGGRRWEYICGGQCCETRQVAVTLKMTVIKVTVGRWIWWFWLANQSSVKRTTAQIQRPPDTSWLMPAPDKKRPINCPPIKLGEMAKNAALSHSAPLISLSFKPYILLYFLPLFFFSLLLITSLYAVKVVCSSRSYYWDSGAEMLIRGASPVFLRVFAPDVAFTVLLSAASRARINTWIGGPPQKKARSSMPRPVPAVTCLVKYADERARWVMSSKCDSKPFFL